MNVVWSPPGNLYPVWLWWLFNASTASLEMSPPNTEHIAASEHRDTARAKAKVPSGLSVCPFQVRRWWKSAVDPVWSGLRPVPSHWHENGQAGTWNESCFLIWAPGICQRLSFWLWPSIHQNERWWKRKRNRKRERSTCDAIFMPSGSKYGDAYGQNRI